MGSPKKPPLSADQEHARKVQLREYKRKKEQWYRERNKQSLESLRDEAAALEATLEGLRQRPRIPLAGHGSLDWRDIALEFKDAVGRARRDNQGLVVQKQAFDRLHEIMSYWINTTSLMSSPTDTWHGINFTLDQALLLAQRDARRQGFDWFTQAMVSNTDSLLVHHGFPLRSLHNDRVGDERLVTSPSTDQPHFVWRYQRELAASLTVVVARMKDHWVDYMRGVAWSSDDEQTTRRRRLDEEILQSLPGEATYVYETSSDVAVGGAILYREFASPARVVIVGQSMPTDETLPRRDVDQKSMTWVVMDSISQRETVVRIMQRNSIHFTKHGEYLSLDDEATRQGFDLTQVPDDEKLEALGRMVTAAYSNESMDAKMARIADACARAAYDIVEL
ncbi:Aste57867_7955 [Aphanomyces stellatus]|uniref:Aste57867_7955 protein n=1 Tax=Aphanomyces stellatus TaxID=120398 RepID=A0A485KJ39_9STRA|nr:hypothetical protein As57867_007925 [Aphanomyces stellatus]VFT84848.1 Aste57867_7955 [Aphanomyces stellatus]